MKKTAIVILVLLAGCGQGGPEKAGNRGSSGVDPTALMIHPVLRQTEVPCGEAAAGEEVLPEMQDGKVVSCLAVGPAALDATHVRKAGLSDVEGEWAVDVELTDAGADLFDQLAAEHLGKRLAITVHEKLASAPTVQSLHFAGRLQVHGLSREEAGDLVEELGGDSTPPTTEPELGFDFGRARDGDERADAVCLANEAKLGGGLAHAGSRPGTAGMITKISKRQLGQSISPWDSLAEDHFVAACTYRDWVAAPADPGPEEEDAPFVKHYLVDEAGRFSGDPLADACGANSTCFYPTG